MLKTIGISPKVALPILVKLVLAAILYAIGYHDMAATLVGASGITGLVGFLAPAGTTIAHGAPPLDDLGEPFATQPYDPTIADTDADPAPPLSVQIDPEAAALIARYIVHEQAAAGGQ